MIDFRYHLISLIAVFLALGLGILMGSVVLSEKYVGRLESRVAQFEQEVNARREEISELNDRLDAFQQFALETHGRLVEGALAGREIVAFEIDGTDEDLLPGVAETFEEAGGLLVSTITLTERFALTDETEREELARILGSASTGADDLRAEAGELLGERAAAVAAAGGTSATQKLMLLLRRLSDEGFIGSSSSEDVPVRLGASFIVAGGSGEEAGTGFVDLSKSLVAGLVDRQRPVMVIEPSISLWDLVAALRDDGTLNAMVSTADHADSVPGRVAVVLGLDLAIDGLLGHYGTESGASSIVPPATPRA